MDEIARACGVQKPSLYYHFGGKEELVLAVIDHIGTHFEKHVFAIAYREAIAVDDRVRQMNTAVERYFNDVGAGCVFGNLALETAGPALRFRPRIRSFFEAWAAAYQHMLAERMPVDEAARMAYGFVAEVQGAIVMMRAFRDREHLRRVSGRLLKALSDQPARG
jgi:TetR/AcrR family transcriptional repressor of nem operon